MPLRFVDLDARTSAYKDFIIRRRSPTLKELFTLCGTLIITGLCLMYATPNPIGLAALLFTIIGLACVYALIHVHRNRRQLESTEFENALFSSALNKGYHFCLIVAKDGTITYANPGFMDLFGTIRSGTNVADWLAAGKVTSDDRAALYVAIAHDGDSQTKVSIESQDNHWLSLDLKVEPILRPAGFMLLRGTDAA
jgi:PAS domain-containing protein